MLYRFDPSKVLEDLYEEIEYQVADVDSFMQEVLATEI
jgi:hypothetical protein